MGKRTKAELEAENDALQETVGAIADLVSDEELTDHDKVRQIEDQVDQLEPEDEDSDDDDDE